MVVVHGRHPEEHKYDGFRAARQHFHRVFDRGVRLVRYIRLHVILHGDAAEGDPVTKERSRLIDGGRGGRHKGDEYGARVVFEATEFVYRS